MRRTHGAHLRVRSGRLTPQCARTHGALGGVSRCNGLGAVLCGTAAPVQPTLYCTHRYSFDENRALHIALFRQLHSLAQRGCHRTALEVPPVRSGRASSAELLSGNALWLVTHRPGPVAA